MIHPLIHNDRRTIYVAEFGYTVFSQYGNTERGDQFRNTVIDLRIGVIWSTGEHDTVAAVFFHISEYFSSFGGHIITYMLHFFPSCSSRTADFLFGNAVFFREVFYQTFC